MRAANRTAPESRSCGACAATEKSSMALLCAVGAAGRGSPGAQCITKIRTADTKRRRVARQGAQQDGTQRIVTPGRDPQATPAFHWQCSTAPAGVALVDQGPPVSSTSTSAAINRCPWMARVPRRKWPRAPCRPVCRWPVGHRALATAAARRNPSPGRGAGHRPSRSRLSITVHDARRMEPVGRPAASTIRATASCGAQRPALCCRCSASVVRAHTRNDIGLQALRPSNTGTMCGCAKERPHGGPRAAGGQHRGVWPCTGGSNLMATGRCRRGSCASHTVAWAPRPGCATLRPPSATGVTLPP